MAIDDPAGIVIREAEQAIGPEKNLPSLLVRLGLSATAAASLVAHPFVAQIFLGLLGTKSARFEMRLLEVVKELDAQQKRIEGKIADKSYYQSEAFQSLLWLILEKLHSTHDTEKLRRFGVALANSGATEFQPDDKEEYIRTLRDLSRKDLDILNHTYLKGWTPHTHVIKYEAEVLCSLSRLVGMGLVIENLKVPPLQPTGVRSSDLQALFTTPPTRTYSLSPFGERFLAFISSGTGDTSHENSQA